MRRVDLLLNPASKFGVLGQMIHDLKAAFERRGFCAVIREYRGEVSSEFVEHIRQDNPDFIWTINTLLDEKWLYYPLGIPHVDLSVDSVTYSYPISFSQPSLVSLFVDKTSCDLFSKLSDRPVHWFPHGIAKEMLDTVRSSPHIPLHDRQFDAVLIGSFIDHKQEKKSWDFLFAPPDVAAFVSFAERSLDDPSFLLLDESLAYMQQAPGLKNILEEGQISPLCLANSIERYARGLDRERLLLALKGRSVTIFTEKEDADMWSKEEAAQGCHFVPAVPFSEVLRICCMSKVVINSAPHIRKGFHERLFLSLASGAVTLVRRGIELPAWLVNTGRVVEYTSGELGGLVPELHEAENRKYDQKKVLSWLEAEHSWDARLEQHLPEIESSVAQLRSDWEENPFFRLRDI